MLGGLELVRKSLNEKDLAMGAAMKDKSEKERKQMMANIEASSSGKMLDDFSHAKGSRKTLNVKHDKDGYIESVDNTKEITWKDTNGKTHKMSRATANEELADAGMFGIVGKAAGIHKMTHGGKDMDIIANNAMGGEAGNIASLNAAIKTAGGIDNFVGFKTASSSLQTTEAIGGTKGKFEEAFKNDLKKEHPDWNNEQIDKMAKKLSDGVLNGSIQGGEALKRALGDIGNVTQTKSAAQLGSDMVSIKEAGGDDGYIKLQSDSAKVKTAQQFGQTYGLLDLPDNQKAAFIRKSLNDAKTMGKYKAVKKDFERAGLVDEHGNPLPQNWIKGISYLKANNMNAHNSLVAGGVVFSGALGDDPTIQAKALNSIDMGNDMKIHTRIKSLAMGFNKFKDKKDQIVLTANGDIDYKNTNNKALENFLKYAQNSSLAKDVKDNFINDSIAKIADATGQSPEAVWNEAGLVGGYTANKMLGNPIGKGFKWTTNKLKSATDKFRGINNEAFDDTPNSTSNSGNNNSDSEPHQTHQNQSTHDNSFSNNMNNSTTKQDLMQQISEKQDNLDKDLDKGKINDDEYVKDYMKYDNLKDKVNANHINVGDLKRNGIDTSHLATDDKGFVDFAKSDENALRAERAMQKIKLDKYGVPGVDPKEKMRFYDPADGRSRAAYFRNNMGVNEPTGLDGKPGFGSALEPEIEPKIPKGIGDIGDVGGIVGGVIMDSAISKLTGQKSGIDLALDGNVTGAINHYGNAMTFGAWSETKNLIRGSESLGQFYTLPTRAFNGIASTVAAAAESLPFVGNGQKKKKGQGLNFEL